MACCDPVYVSFGPWLYVFCYQVKVMTDHELLGYACEQFLGKTVAEIKSVILQTLEGHLRSILGEWCQTLVSILNGTLLSSLWRIQTVCTVSFRSKFLPDEQHMTSNHSQQINQSLGHYVVKSFLCLHSALRKSWKLGNIMTFLITSSQSYLLLLTGTLTVEQIYQDRDQFAKLVREVAAPDVGRMGIEILSFTIKVCLH